VTGGDLTRAGDGTGRRLVQVSAVVFGDD